MYIELQYNINWKDGQRKNVVNNADVTFKTTMTKWPVNKKKHTHRTTQNHADHQDATDITKNPFFCVFCVFVCKTYIHQCANVSIKPLNNTHYIKRQRNWFKQLKSRLNTIIMVYIIKHALFCLLQSDASKKLKCSLWNMTNLCMHNFYVATYAGDSNSNCLKDFSPMTMVITRRFYSYFR